MRDQVVIDGMVLTRDQIARAQRAIERPRFSQGDRVRYHGDNAEHIVIERELMDAIHQLRGTTSYPPSDKVVPVIDLSDGCAYLLTEESLSPWQAN